MKAIMISLLVSGLSTWATTTTAHAQEEGDCNFKILVGGDGDVECINGGDSKVFVIKAKGIGEGEGKVAWVSAFGENDGRSDKDGNYRIVLRSFGGNKDRGWLGVSIGNVSKALADQLDLDGDGVLIQNVVKGSPADKGGLKANDVILSINGDAVGNQTGRAIELIKVNKPGDDVDIVVLRDGREKELTITLGSRGDSGNVFSWKTEIAPDVEFEDSIRTFGHVMRRGDDGVWSMENLGDLKMLKGLPGNLKMFLPKGGNRSTQVFVEGGTTKVKTRVENDGNVIVVERAGDGDITVTRVDEDGVETENVYTSKEELQDADEEAFDLLDSTGAHTMLHFDTDSLDDLDFSFEFDSDEWKERMGDWHEKMEQGFFGALEIQEGAMEKLHEALENLKIDDVHLEGLEQLKNLRGIAEIKEGTLERLQEALENLHFDGADIRVLDNLKGHRAFFRNGPGAARTGSFSFGKPKHNFEVRADGTIEVTIRRGDSQMTQLFEDEDDLADRKPKLYEKYRKLMDVDDE